MKNTVDLSYEGRITTPQLDAIQEVVSHYKPSNIVLINDKDNGGYAYDCTILGHLNRGEQDSKFSFEFHNNSNQEKTVVNVTMELPKNRNEWNIEEAERGFNNLAEKLSAIEFNGKPLVCEQVTYNEITDEYNLKGSFIRLHENHATPFIFQQKVFEVCQEQFSNNLSQINVVNHKAPSGDWNQELMNKLGLDKSMIMANQNPFLGMNKEDAMQMSKSMGASQGQGLGNAKVNNNETELSSSGR